MQTALPLHDRKPLTPADDNNILHVSLPEIAPEGHIFALNPSLQIISHLVCNDDGYAVVIQQRQFTGNEFAVLRTLFESHPYFGSYDELQASYTYGHTSKATIARCAEYLQEAKTRGQWDQIVKPLRVALSRSRPGMHALGIEVAAIFETGYRLQAPGTSRRSVPDEEIQARHYVAVRGLLSAEVTLALDSTLGVLSRLVVHDGQPRLAQQQQFAPKELRVLEPLLDAYPSFCPHAVVLASLSGQADEVSVARYRKHLEEALKAGTWDQELRAARNVLTRTRHKTRALGIQVCSIVETGYMLIPISNPRERR